MLVSDIDGSYIKIHGDGLELGATAQIKFNTNNLKIYDGKFAVGSNLNCIDNDTAPGTRDGFIGILYNPSWGLLVRDVTVYELTALGNDTSFKVNGSKLGFYDTSTDNGIFTLTKTND
jgi:hypothetical protein